MQIRFQLLCYSYEQIGLCCVSYNVYHQLSCYTCLTQRECRNLHNSSPRYQLFLLPTTWRENSDIITSESLSHHYWEGTVFSFQVVSESVASHIGPVSWEHMRHPSPSWLFLQSFCLQCTLIAIYSSCIFQPSYCPFSMCYLSYRLYILV